MFGLFKNGKTEPDTELGKEILKQQSMLLARKISRRNDEGDVTEDSESKQVLYVTYYLTDWFIRWSLFELRQTKEQNLRLSEIGPSLIVLDAFLINISERYGLSQQALAQLWDAAAAYFLRQFAEAGDKEKKKVEILAAYREHLFKAIAVLKTMERVTPDAIEDLQNRVNMVVLEAIDVFVLEDEDSCSKSFKNLYYFWSSLLENYDELVANSR